MAVALMVVPGARAGAQTPPEAPVPPLTDEDRRAAFPDVPPHRAEDNAVHAFLLADQIEWRAGRSADAAAWDARGWIGTDRTRMWLRSEGEGRRHGIEAAEAHVLYGRMIARWWDIVGGVRQDVRPGDPQTWAAIGLQGLAPYWFDVEATAYVGASGRTQVRVKSEYEVLLSNRLILQPLVEVDVNGKADAPRGLGAGLSRTTMGLRWRYEIRREVAPYAGLEWDRQWFGTADLSRRLGGHPASTRLVVGVRLWH
jgi:copper resistance protein B